MAEGDGDEAPKARAVHADPAAPASAEQQPLPKGVTRKPVKKKSPAEWAYQRLILYIKHFEERLDNEHEVAIGLAGGDIGVMRIEGIGYFDPDIVTFYGKDMTGARTQLVQHVTQLNVMLRAVPRPATEPEPRRIGFHLVRDLDAEDEEPIGP